MRGFFGAFENPTPAAFVIVVHMMSDHPSALAKTLDGLTEMPVREAADGDEPLPGHVYVIPPGHGLKLEDGRFRLEDPPEERRRRPIDTFLATLAADRGRLAVGVILSGAGQDGVEGLLEIQRRGGTTFAQDPATAAYDSMPRLAIESGAAQYVTEVEHIAALLGRLLEGLLEEPGSGSPQDSGTRKLWHRPESLLALDTQVLAPLVEAAPPRSTLRVWVPKCGRGEDAWMIAILLFHRIRERGDGLDFKLFATDADERALGEARGGTFDAEQVEDLPDEWLEYLVATEDGGYEATAELRHPLRFSSHDFATDPPFSRLDLLASRRLSLADSNQRLATLLHFVIRAGGYCFLGEPDLVAEDPALLTCVDLEHGIYRRGHGRADARQLSRLVARQPPTRQPLPARHELETSSEQTHTLIEELHMVNSELQDRISEVEEARDDLENLVLATDIATLFLDRDLRIQRFTPAMQELLRLIDGDVGRRIDQLAPRDLSAEIGRRAATLLDTGEAMERLVETADERTYIERIRPYRTASGEMTGAVITCFDITERVRIDHERRQLEERLLHTQRMEVIGQLAGGISHDFNNLLTHIFLSIDKGLRGWCPAPQKAAFESISDAASRARNLTHRLLAFSRRQTLERQVLDLDTLLERLSVVLARVLGERIRLTSSFQAAPAPVLADAAQLEQVFVNLAINARDAMRGMGEIQLETEAAEMPASSPSAGAPAVKVRLRDHGRGMEAEIRERAFEPFFTTKAAGQGSGLGLAMVHGIVKQHGGEIDLESSPGEGTTVTVFLPLESTAKAAAKATPRRRELPTGHETLLFIEDEAEILELAADSLRQLGYEVFTASSAEAGEAIFEQRSEEIDLLVSDVVLPGKNGLEAALSMRLKRPDLEVLLVSGYSYDALHEIDLGQIEDVHFLAKPFSLRQLTDKIRETLSGESTPDFSPPDLDAGRSSFDS